MYKCICIKNIFPLISFFFFDTKHLKLVINFFASSWLTIYLQKHQQKQQNIKRKKKKSKKTYRFSFVLSLLAKIIFLSNKENLIRKVSAAFPIYFCWCCLLFFLIIVLYLNVRSQQEHIVLHCGSKNVLRWQKLITPL